jgi:predicted methyltransferase
MTAHTNDCANNNRLCIFIVAAALAIGACGDKAPPESTATPEPAAERQSPPAEAEPAPDDLQSRLADTSRPEADRVRDAGRKPAQVLEYLGIEQGMNVIDLIAAGGYYTEVLSLAVGPEGHVVAQNTDAALQFRDGANEKEISERLAGNRLPNVTRLNKNFDAITSADGSFDAAITNLNFHDIYNGPGPEAAVAMLESVYTILKPGGVLGVIDHVGVAGFDNAALHRMDKAKVIESAEAAGFLIAGDSDLLRNETDDHSLAVFDESIRGKTDRFLLKLQKPIE